MDSLWTDAFLAILKNANLGRVKLASRSPNLRDPGGHALSFARPLG